MSPALVFGPSPSVVSVAPTSSRQEIPSKPDVYGRRRLVALAVALGLVLGLVSFGRQAGANRTAEARAADAVTVVVQPGDTLWGIARTLAPGDDPRPLADALSDLVGGTTIHPGQRIVVPGGLVD